jgi:hypothetical protein
MSLFRRRKNPEPVQEAPVIEKGIPGEVIAVIAAAVAMMFGAGVRVAGIRRSTRSGAGKAAWRNAGVSENTRPF